MKLNTKRFAQWFLAAALAVTGLWAYTSAPISAPWAEFGYYGHFNQVQRILKTFPELRIVDHWQHHDVIMEDFSFTVEHRDGGRFRIDFWENTPQMRLSRDSELRNFLEREVEEQLRKQNWARSSTSAGNAAASSAAKP